MGSKKIAVSALFISAESRGYGAIKKVGLSFSEQAEDEVKKTTSDIKRIYILTLFTFAMTCQLNSKDSSTGRKSFNVFMPQDSLRRAGITTFLNR